MSNLINHAKRELSLLRSTEPDEMQDAIDAHVLRMVEVFSEAGHSGTSAPYTISILSKILAFEPVTPLKGDESEWNEVSAGVFQNNRCSTVFRQADRFDGQAYDIEGRIFKEPSGSCYTSRDSMVPITFPYTPSREYVNAPETPEATTT